jgi:hypothetical protein
MDKLRTYAERRCAFAVVLVVILSIMYPSTVRAVCQPVIDGCMASFAPEVAAAGDIITNPVDW